MPRAFSVRKLLRRRCELSLRQILDGLNACLSELPLRVRIERGDMARHLIVQMCAEYERAPAEGSQTARATWHEMATGLIDGIVGLWTAPVTT